MTRGILFEVFRRADNQPAPDELVQVAVGPPKGRLQHLVQLREIEVARQFQRPADNRLNPQNLGVEPDDEVVGIEVLCHAVIMPPQRAAGKLEGTSSAGKQVCAGLSAEAR